MATGRHTQRAIVVALAVAFLATALVTAPPATAAPPLTCAAPGFTNIQPSEWQDQGPDVFQFLCNFGRGSGAPYNGGVAITVRYQCPAATDDEWRSKTANRDGDLVNNKASEVAQSDEGSFSTFVGDFTRQERGFLRPDANTIITVVTYADAPGLYSQAKGPALSLASSHRASATLPCGSTPSTGPTTTGGPGQPPTTPRPTAPSTQPTTTVYTPPPTVPLSTTSTQVPCLQKKGCPQNPPRPLCDDATALLTGWSQDKLAKYNIDPQASTLVYDEEGLTTQFRRAVDQYNADHRDKGAYADLSTPGSSLSAVTWLFSEGGALSTLVPAHSRAYVEGHEKDLRKAIIDESNRRKLDGRIPQLDPGEVYGLSLQLTGGNATRAALLAHNTLRSLGRGGDLEFTGVMNDATFFTEYLVPLRGGTEQAGPWYHLFGMTYYQLQYGNDAGVPASVLLLAGIATGAVTLGTTTALAGIAATVSLLINPEFANQAEQIYREHLAKEKRDPDPEKYCYNVYGRRLGRLLTDLLPSSLNREVPDAQQPPQIERAFPPVVTRDTRPEDIRSVDRSEVVNLMQSPYAIEWNVDGERVVMEQGPSPDQAIVEGSAKMAMLPVREADSYGALWLTPPQAKQGLTFVATRDGAPMHYLRVDMKSADVYVYDPVAVKKGDRFTIAPVDESQLAPDMVGPDGKVLRPRKESLRSGDTNGFTATAPAAGVASPGRSIAPLLVLLGAVVAGLLLLLFVLLLRRRRAPALATATATASGSGTAVGAPAAPSTATMPASGGGTYGYVHASQPLLDGARQPVGTLEPGSWYEVVQREGDWAQVRLTDGRTGWTAAATLHDR
jgi:hypothetical protein